MANPTVRPAAVAGQFYPADPVKLKTITHGYITGSDVEPDPAHVHAIVSPHAGFVYSGPTAGFAYARIRGKAPKRVILLGCSHRFAFPTASVVTEGGFETPAGTFPIDATFAEAVAEHLDSVGDEAHGREHGLEVQLPFLAEALGIVPIVPILFGAPASEWHAEAGRTLARMADPSDLLIVSTDLSHYLTERQANALDTHSLETVLHQDWRAYVNEVKENTCSMCGAAAVTAAMAYALERGATKWQLLDYRTSAHASHDYERVVGYAALSLEQAA